MHSPPQKQSDARLGLTILVGWLTTEGKPDPGVPSEPESICYVYWPILDGPPPSNRAILGELARFLSELILRGQVVLVRCGAGFNRSGLLNALVVRRVLAVGGAEAIEIVRKGRPGALTNEEFVEFILEGDDPQ